MWLIQRSRLLIAIFLAFSSLEANATTFLTVPRAIPVDLVGSALAIPRGGGGSLVAESLEGLQSFMKGSKNDALVLLGVTALNTPISQSFLKISPILGFLLFGLLFGPNGFKIISDVHGTEHLADFGIVLFLFEMGIHLDLKTLWSIRTDVFGIGLTQFATTTLAITAFCSKALNLPLPASVIIGWALALSSSAFVLQLLKDKNQMETNYGKSSFGTLLLQDLMVVPLLVMTPLLGGGGESVSKAISKAGVSILLAVVAIVGIFGKILLSPLLDMAVKSNSKEALIGFILASVFGGSFLTEGLGLSNTLGAFLMGMLMAETKHRHLVEHEISIFRGVLVGLFFFTVGFEIDLNLIRSQPVLIAGTVLGIMLTKIILATGSCLQFGVPFSVAQRIGLVLSQGGEFAFVAFRTARAAGILNEDQTRLLLTCVSLTMACTPFLEDYGARLEQRLEGNTKKRKTK